MGKRTANLLDEALGVSGLLAWPGAFGLQAQWITNLQPSRQGFEGKPIEAGDVTYDYSRTKKHILVSVGVRKGSKRPIIIRHFAVVEVVASGQLLGTNVYTSDVVAGWPRRIGRQLAARLGRQIVELPDAIMRDAPKSDEEVEDDSE